MSAEENKAANISFPVAVRVEKVTKTFPNGDTPTYALRDVSFEALSGRLTMIVGPSGCGKTTLLSVICGTMRTDSGRIEVFGKDLGTMSDAEITGFRSRNVGFIFQQFNLIPTLTLVENASVPLILVVPVSSPARDVAGLVAWLRQNPAARSTDLLKKVFGGK
jgi:putative ABC transport system ATP-binding protein